ncbi:hypothetical protein H0H92_006118 [Tricholoma furcatifolium]|nr:hypothetical protein H0H92_006118 [Tricholoma furcatifolium]
MCMQQPTIDQMVACFDNFTVPWNYYTQETYNAAQPTPSERSAWLDAINSLLNVNGNCSSVELSSTIIGTYAISQFYDPPSAASYCVLSEINASVNGTQYAYEKGWGLFITPMTPTSVLRNIHLSAPHPGYDLGTPQQAVALFRSTGAKSLLIAGRSRLAFESPSSCVSSPSPKTTYYVTDPAHNKEEPFYDATRTIYDWQMNNGDGCPSPKCAFIQFHGKGPSTCRSDHMFVSAGLGMDTFRHCSKRAHYLSYLGNDRASKQWYSSPTQYPAKRLKAELGLAFPEWNISLPVDSKCGLTATKNVVGRFLNGVADDQVCTMGASASFATGLFVHVEQSEITRNPNAYDGWTEALAGAFETVKC